MKIDVRIVSMHGDANRETGLHDVPDGTTVTGLLGSLSLSGEETYAVLLNDMPVGLDEREETVLSPGDKVTVFPPIMGG